MTKFGQLFGRIYKRTKDNFFIIYSRTWLSSYLATAGYLAKNYKVYVVCIMQKEPPRSVLRKRSSGNMHQIYRRTPVPKCKFNKVALLSCKFAVYFQNTFPTMDNYFWLRQNSDLVKISDQQVTVRWKK